MNAEEQVELFVLKCASLKIAVDGVSPGATADNIGVVLDQPGINSSLEQFSQEVRTNANRMAEYYKLFYMLENDIRKLIDDTLIEAHGVDWWDKHSPNSAKEECKANQQREKDAGFTSRSDNELDYISFGQLGDIIRNNWDLFGGILSNQKALGRVMYSLNNLRGPIAHCGLLAEDEVDRLKLTVKDWFRLLEGPK
ncbi:Swt1 family HEPN domain-containing protein [Rhizobium mayense]|uniref:Swt1 family HEPN domain-containing protein n=1 Tax=Rhizobium mayense TaxID=1312184 RepID=A0ABT7JTX5_9HYPH|nr:Swt1 family HEPN domain-containing protein [Rhizobium mayense]MDL2399215.1 Swt1 family HEPN domain-containing protein [Rhizobium mayense]